VSDAPSLYTKARTDVAAILGYDLDNLSGEQSLRLDIATSLRVLLDNQSGRLLRGESLDAREMLMASDALSRLLPPMREPAPEADRVDPRQIMFDTYMAMRRRGEIADEIAGPKYSHNAALKRIVELEARIAELEAGASPAPCPLGGANEPPATRVAPVDNSAPVPNVVPLRPSPPASPPPATPVFGKLVGSVADPREDSRNYVDGQYVAPGAKWWGPC
jgi:hypothetical protein